MEVDIDLLLLVILTPSYLVVGEQTKQLMSAQALGADLAACLMGWPALLVRGSLSGLSRLVAL